MRPPASDPKQKRRRTHEPNDDASGKAKLLRAALNSPRGVPEMENLERDRGMALHRQRMVGVPRRHFVRLLGQETERFASEPHPAW